jgi:adenosylcobinamide-GDP ribazoletransferase
MNSNIRAWLDDISTATVFLTRIPVPHRHQPPNFVRAYRAFPLLGAAIGAAIGTLDLVLLRIGLPPIAAAALALGAGALLTGALHEDGLADIADGFGGGRDKAGKLAVMRDSRLGTYGVLALLTGFVAKVGALSALSGSDVVLALMATHALARAPIAVLAAVMPYARTDGLAIAAGRPDFRIALTACGVAMVIAFLALPAASAILAIVIAAIAAASVAILAERQIGGQTGDVLGAAEQVCEIVVLLALAARAGQV